MNTLKGIITGIESNNELSLVKLTAGNTVFTAIVIDTPKTANYLKTGNTVKIYFKETEVILAKGADLKISIQNKIPCKISAVNPGTILSEIDLQFGNETLKSIITTNACNQLGLQVNDNVTALVKTNEISLAPHD